MIDMKISREESNILRAIAIMSVIITHANGWAHAFDKIPLLNNGKLTSFACQGGMALFLILSGYGLYKSYISKGLSGYWDNKFKKIFAPAIIIQVLWFLLCGIMNGNLISQLASPRDTLFAELMCLNQLNDVEGTMWYLSYLFFCYMSFFIFFSFAKKANYAVAFFLFFWVITMPVVAMLWGNSKSYVSCFAVGILLAFLERRFSIYFSLSNRVIVLLILLSILIVYVRFMFRKFIFCDNVASILLAFSLILAVKITNCRRQFFVGKHSFALYLLEGKIIFGWFNYDTYSVLPRFVVFIMLLVVTLIVSVFVDKVIEERLL